MIEVVTVAAVMLVVIVMVTAATTANICGALTACQTSFRAFYIG